MPECSYTHTQTNTHSQMSGYALSPAPVCQLCSVCFPVPQHLRHYDTVANALITHAICFLFSFCSYALFFFVLCDFVLLFNSYCFEWFCIVYVFLLIFIYFCLFVLFLCMIWTFVFFLQLGIVRFFFLFLGGHFHKSREKCIFSFQ